MNIQREKPGGVTAEELNAMVGLPANSPTLVSGTQIENFRHGWAKRGGMPLSDRAHYFVREGFEGARSLCGVEAEVRWMYGQGNFPRCSRCQGIVDRNRVRFSK